MSTGRFQSKVGELLTWWWMGTFFGAAISIPVYGRTTFALVVMGVIGPLWVGLVDDTVNWGLGPGWCVYQLVDQDGLCLYVGSTNDIGRRVLEHTAGTGDPWRARIAGYNVARWCRSERQARRLEQRRIRVINLAADHARCPALHNEVYRAAHRRLVHRATTALWSPFYLLMSITSCAACYHTFAADYRVIPQRPDPDTDDWMDDPDPDPPMAASYQRRRPPPPRHAVTFPALPPVRDTSQPAPSPLRGDAPPERDTSRRDSVTDQRDRYADAFDRLADVMSPETEAGSTTTVVDDDETPEERRRRLSRERQAKRRARLRGEQ